MDELVCFLAGTLALGQHNGLPREHLTLAQELAYTCYLTFARQPTFLAPEISYFNTEPGSTKDFYVKVSVPGGTTPPNNHQINSSPMMLTTC